MLRLLSSPYRGLVLLVFILSGCSDTNPSVGVLKNIQGLQFENTQIITSSLGAVALQASCSPFVGNIEMSFDAGNSWISPQSHDPDSSGTCQSGVFKMKLRGAAAPLTNSKISMGQIIKLKFRVALGAAGWAYQDVDVKYMPSTALNQEILAGSKVSKNEASDIVLRGRIRSQKQEVSRGGDLVIRGRIIQ